MVSEYFMDAKTALILCIQHAAHWQEVLYINVTHNIYSKQQAQRNTSICSAQRPVALAWFVCAKKVRIKLYKYTQNTGRQLLAWQYNCKYYTISLNYAKQEIGSKFWHLSTYTLW